MSKERLAEITDVLKLVTPAIKSTSTRLQQLKLLKSKLLDEYEELDLELAMADGRFTLLQPVNKTALNSYIKVLNTLSEQDKQDLLLELS